MMGSNPYNTGLDRTPANSQPLTPLTFLGGVFYSIEMLPGVWPTVSKFNPVLYMVNGIRYGMTGVSDVSIQMCFTVVVSLCLLFLVTSLWLLATGKNIRE